MTVALFSFDPGLATTWYLYGVPSASYSYLYPGANLLKPVPMNVGMGTGRIENIHGFPMLNPGCRGHVGYRQTYHTCRTSLHIPL